jgi:hypothetical protein
VPEPHTTAKRAEVVIAEVVTAETEPTAPSELYVGAGECSPGARQRDERVKRAKRAQTSQPGMEVAA